MAKKTSTPAASTPSLKKSSSSGGQRTLLGFFQKTPSSTGSPGGLPARTATTSTPAPVKLPAKSGGTTSSGSSLTPVPSSDAAEPEVDTEDDRLKASLPAAAKGLLSPVSTDEGQTNGVEELTARGTPSRRAKKKAVRYIESDSEGTDNDDDVFKPTPVGRSRRTKRRRLSDSAEEDLYEQENDAAEQEDDDMDDFIAPDDSEDDIPRPSKRKRPSQPASRKVSSHFTPTADNVDIDMDLEAAEGSSTAQQWAYDPANPQPLQARSSNIPSRKPGGQDGKKQKAHMTEPEQRHAWLEDIRDIDRNPPGHPDYDPRTLYIPPMAWTKFSPFEKQYWEIKQKLWDTIVFFKKGKFYELYENDATIGHQLFDLKLTDRVNMRMVGVPESSLEMWANQFVAKGFKVARVDQQETALGKNMRERDEKSNMKKGKEDKVIRRELACVLTAGTLVDGTMLQDDMSTYCVAIKESEIDNMPAFGVAFVDTATGQFHISQFVDDSDLTRFETFVAQTRPQEILLEKGEVSMKTLRILKNNTGPTTIWNYLKPGKEFWEGHITAKEIEASDYFPMDWPEVLQQAREKDLLMSALGALICYLRTLNIERELVTLGNFTWYDPIRKATSLVLDGQTLINLEVFANSYDGGIEGTLFQLLNRCITPFGKRMFKQWVCHPLMDTKKINARLDAVDSLNRDTKVRDRFTSQMTKLPDLERLISRVHAGSCKVQDFVKVLEGFEQIDHTMSLLRDGDAGSNLDSESVIGQLITAMPDLQPHLKYWMDAFDRTKAKETGILEPERGIEEDFDNSKDTIDAIQDEFNVLLHKWRKEFGSSGICYRDSGKEIMQLEVPLKVKGIPKNWDQMSATKQVKRYYFPELRSLVRKLQEAQETHSQIVKEVAGRFFARFDEKYEIWLAAIRIIAQLDCLISLAKASSSLGYPSCRPEFIDDDQDAASTRLGPSRSTLELVELRHPCLLAKVDDFIPNDVVLGGTGANLSLLTGANAAGKSTVLRMTCIAVIMAQIGCYLPCLSARLTPFDRIMSRLGAQDHIFAAQSTFFVELAETKKILSEATPRSLVILDELGRGTSSHDGVAVAQAVLHHLASHVGCLGFFATHYHSLSAEFKGHPEIEPQRMKILVDDEQRRVTFLYKLERGVAEGSFGMHCASMCGIPARVVDRAQEAAREWEYTSLMARKLKAGANNKSNGQDSGNDGSDSNGRSNLPVPLGILSDVAWILKEDSKSATGEDVVTERSIDTLARYIEAL
ncbi:DNA mismatch repair protein msh6 [Exophiala dermatitidis]|uniref:DNA mismatch repair protein n=2 Tax=Exophiala dermatitidis TaxID=5970 RepID=H6BKB8_EXODN|nr:DNA mismatch repair protein MSH6 [Exophiala dermatitidis NIH/UT8656]KAJ4509725.1 DNA mismatch repair protein msh6 [Exophiala dermatitidis]EHY52552.1 DNA mismatch repair protein MSH6 [Exophiala dermatitidis NIH/UT8656]KAJ4512440.1 DNA mismatch repair protein msh6 [Exophiala dermatitidis]KAJ4512685.1 DNA mismatch repair protein msh6 [Exophiala dermatitidis]KAJ4546582.1 DNA mismatch repair protein msh6 [Exophiala dermatitidis]